jgi:hypothetical protein
MRRLLVTASVVSSSPILVTLMKEALRSSEMSVLTRATRRNIPEDTILHSHRRGNLKSYIMYSHLALVRSHAIRGHSVSSCCVLTMFVCAVCSCQRPWFPARLHVCLPTWILLPGHGSYRLSLPGRARRGPHAAQVRDDSEGSVKCPTGNERI